jgi:hypothetical protein
MWLRPWHVIVCVVALAGVLIGCASVADGRPKDVLLGLGVNLLSSTVFFILLELYWQRMKRANGKEVDGFDYLKFARNVGRSRQVRVLGTFIYPLTSHPRHAAERQALLDGLRVALRQPSSVRIQILLLHPESQAAHARAAERKDDDVIQRIEEALDTLRALAQSPADAAQNRIEVRLFARTPPFALFQTDNFASISFYFRDRPISEVSRYEFFLDSPLGEFVEKTFDDLWRDEQTVPLSGYPGARPGLSPDQPATAAATLNSGGIG